MAEPRTGAGLDPARDAALLLQRMGFFALGVALPVTALLSRRAAVVLAPFGVALLVIAALLLEPERFVRSFKRRSVKATSLVLLLLVSWSALSTIWAPRGAPSADRIFNMLFALVLGIMGVAALPERVRAANLNALAVGTGLATLVAAASFLLGHGLRAVDDGATILIRGLALIIILTGPLTAWLLSRGRTRGGMALGGVVALVSVLTGEPALVLALAFGAAAFGLVILGRGTAVGVLAAGSVLLVLLAPAAPWLIKPLAALLPLDGDALESLNRWGETIRLAPVKLITGHGFGAVHAMAHDHLAPIRLPGSVLVEIWHELGIVGALAFATSLWFAMNAVRVLAPVIQAGAISAYVAALVFGVIGLAGFRAWWLMTLVAVVIVTTAVARGQARSDRPLARFVRPATQAPG